LVASCARSTKAFLDFGIQRYEFNQTKLNPQQRYLQYLASHGNRCVKGSENIVDLNRCIYLASIQNDINLLKYFIGQRRIKYFETLNNSLFEAVKNNNKELTMTLLFEGKRLARVADKLSKAINISASEGYLELTEYLFNLEKWQQDSINEFLSAAAESGNQQLVDFFIKRGANDLNSALVHAASNGKIEMINYLIAKGSVLCATATDLRDAFDNANLNEQLDVVIYIISNRNKIKTQYPSVQLPEFNDFKISFEDAVRYGYLELAKYLLSFLYHLNRINPLIPLPTKEYLESAIKVAGSQEVIKYLQSIIE